MARHVQLRLSQNKLHESQYLLQQDIAKPLLWATQPPLATSFESCASAGHVSPLQPVALHYLNVN